MWRIRAFDSIADGHDYPRVRRSGIHVSSHIVFRRVSVSDFGCVAFICIAVGTTLAMCLHVFASFASCTRVVLLDLLASNCLACYGCCSRNCEGASVNIMLFFVNAIAFGRSVVQAATRILNWTGMMSCCKDIISEAHAVQICICPKFGCYPNWTVQKSPGLVSEGLRAQ